jgi:hypothetical protein
MHFGQLEQSTFAHSQQIDQMIQRSTGSLDVISLAQRSGGDARPGAVSMMLSGIVKRHKRTLMNFVDRFYVPALRKILWRNMQYYPERYTPRNWQFLVSGTMGILQREYESSNLVQLLNTMEPQSPEYKMILMGVISNTGLVHRRELIEMLKKSISMAQQAQQMQQQAAVDPQLQGLQQQLGQMQVQLQIAETQAKIAELTSRARLQDAKSAERVARAALQVARRRDQGHLPDERRSAGSRVRSPHRADRSLPQEQGHRLERAHRPDAVRCLFRRAREVRRVGRERAGEGPRRPRERACQGGGLTPERARAGAQRHRQRDHRPAAGACAADRRPQPASPGVKNWGFGGGVRFAPVRSRLAVLTDCTPT